MASVLLLLVRKPNWPSVKINLISKKMLAYFCVFYNNPMHYGYSFTCTMTCFTHFISWFIRIAQLFHHEKVHVKRKSDIANANSQHYCFGAAGWADACTLALLRCLLCLYTITIMITANATAPTEIPITKTTESKSNRRQFISSLNWCCYRKRLSWRCV